MKLNMNRLQVAALVAILFIMVGWIAPVVWASYAPADSVASVSEFTVQNATVGDEKTRVCFTRTIHNPQTAEIHARIVLMENSTDGVQREVLRTEMTRYFGPGTKTVESWLPLNPHMPEGWYYYRVTSTFDLANGRVERDITTTSEPFYVSDDPNAGSDFVCDTD